MVFSKTIPCIEAILVPNATLITWLYKVCCRKFLTTVLCCPRHFECHDVVQTPPIYILSKPQPRRSCCQWIWLLNLEVQGSNLAVDIFSFITNFFHGHCDHVEHAPAHMWEHGRMGYAPYLHICQVNVLVLYCIIIIQLPVFHLTAGLPAIKSTTWLQIFHRTKVIASNLQNCCSNEDSSTVPWLFVSLSVNYVRKSRKRYCTFSLSHHANSCFVNM